nr:TonB-dependent receptor [uncultured Roseateles sp.]
MNSKYWQGFQRTALSAAVMIVAAAPVMAQNTTAAIGGRITTADGKPVAGATVSIVHRESGSANTLTTDSEGRYSARGLRVGGPYTITVSKGGDREVRDDVFLALAESLTLDATLGSTATALSTVTVTGQSTANSRFNSTSMGSGTNLGLKEIEAQASIARNLQDYARADPRLAQTDKDRGEISAAGQNSRFNNITIDGVRTNDMFGLESNNLPTVKQPISIDAIQAVQVNLSNYDVTQQGYTGANINAVTKSGTNELKGSVYYVFRNDSMAGLRYDRNKDTYFGSPPFKDTTKGFVVGGPIIKDKLFFFASYEELKSNRDAPQFGPVGSNLTNVGITQAQIDAATQVAKSKYGIDIGGIPAAEDLLVKDTLLKLDWNISDKHRANLRYAKTDQSQPIAPGFTSTTLSLESRFYTTEKSIETVVGQIFSDWTENFSTEFKLSKRDYLSVPINKSAMPEVMLVFTAAAPSGTATGNRTLRFGTEETRHFNRLETKTTNAYLAGNLNLDDHEVKFGGDYEKNNVFNAFVRRANGQYTFQGTDPVALFQAGVPTAYRIQVPLPGKTLNDAAADMSFNNLGLFLQDTWTVNKRFTVNAGVRIDRVSTGNNPLANAGVALAPGVDAATGRATGGFGYDNTHTFDGEQLVQPRVGFNYAFDTADKRKSQLRGGFGLFQGAAASVWLANPYQNTGLAVADYTCGPTGTPCNTLAYNADPAHQPVVVGAAAQNVDIIAPGVTQPSVWKFNLAYDVELPWYGLVAGAELLHTKVKQGLNYKHLNLGAATIKSPLDGRDMFWNAAGRSTNCWATGGTTTGGTTAAPCNSPSTRDLRNRGYNDVTLIESSSKGGGNALTLSLSGANKGAFTWSTAYTRTSATEVSPLTSSTSFSNFANRAIFNPNEEGLANSSYLIRERFNGTMTWSKAFVGKYKTSFGLFYEGREGKPYSWTYGNDMNGDGVTNDLMYIPKAPGSGEVLFRLPGKTVAESSVEAENKFWSIVDGEKSLRDAKGGVVKRNTAFSKFTNSFDVRISQELPGLFANHKGVVSLDILNFGNLINRRWGRIDEIGFRDGSGGYSRSLVNFAGIDPATGKVVYSVADPGDYTTKQNKGESQWAIQVTLKYEF